MPCRVEHTPYWPRKKTQNYTATRLLTWLQTYLHEDIGEEAFKEWEEREDAVPTLCAKIKKLGGTDYIEQLVKDNPQDGMWSNHASQMSKELKEWWKEHEWRDGIRERMEQRTKELREEGNLK